MHISGSRCDAIPRAESFLVLMIFAAYSCPDDFFTHLRTTEKAPLRTKKINKQKLVPFHMLSLTRTESDIENGKPLMRQWSVYETLDQDFFY